MNDRVDDTLLSPAVLWSQESESTLLGALLLDNGMWDRVGDLVEEADFFRQEHRLVFQAISSLLNACKPVDVFTVFDQLQRIRKDDVVGLPYLNALAQYVPSASSARQYALTVRDFSLRRKLMGVSTEIHALACQRSVGFEETLDQATALLTPLFEVNKSDAWQGMDTGMVEFLDGIQRRADGEEDFLSTGIKDLDDRLDGGVRKGEVVVIAGRPGMGKTALAMSIADHICGMCQPVGVLSMEMPKAQLTTRVVSMRSGIPLHKLKRPERLTDYDWGEMTRTVEHLRQLPMFIDDQTALNINQLRAKARSLKRRHGLRLLVVDYIGLMEGTDRKANRATQLGEVSRGIKALAKELDCTVLLLAQLNREVEKRPNMRPIMADLRECGDIEQDADIIAFVHRPAHAKPDLGPEWKHYAEIIVGKQRDGQTGIVDAQYTGDTVKFCNWMGDRPTSLVRTKGTEL
ncbi:replicative DNA helicase [Variovorax sp. CAN2819]|uniref:replicative DNA helicase n=1 Tax=Variovorax sp. CAN15 TaxID=3046727 RepID=UPI00264A2298|nr:replicative DNA helicase [Variovorax sp. CAN15]MDN6885309.1 replicative DNA helicase [Variovorax sp. CAN15]